MILSDVNDVAPKFSDTVYMSSLAATNPAEAVIAGVLAFDLDEQVLCNFLTLVERHACICIPYVTAEYYHNLALAPD